MALVNITRSVMYFTISNFRLDEKVAVVDIDFERSARIEVSRTRKSIQVNVHRHFLPLLVRSASYAEFQPATG